MQIFIFLFFVLLFSMHSLIGVRYAEYGRMEKRVFHDFSSSISKEDKGKKRAVESSLLRVCRNISILMKKYNCPGNDQATVVWGFIPEVAGGTYVGLLNRTWSGSTSSTFSCASKERHGRWLLQRSIPSNYISSAPRIGFDLSGISDTNVDPCGYTDITNIQ